jgi:hypothetical protein
MPFDLFFQRPKLIASVNKSIGYDQDQHSHYQSQDKISPDYQNGQQQKDYPGAYKRPDNAVYFFIDFFYQFNHNCILFQYSIFIYFIEYYYI